MKSRICYLILPCRTSTKFNSTVWYPKPWDLSLTYPSMLLTCHCHETSVLLWGSPGTPCFSTSVVLATLLPPTTCIYWLAFKDWGSQHVLGVLWGTCSICYSFHHVSKIISNWQMRKPSFRDLSEWRRNRVQFEPLNSIWLLIVISLFLSFLSFYSVLWEK